MTAVARSTLLAIVKMGGVENQTQICREECDWVLVMS